MKVWQNCEAPAPCGLRHGATNTEHTGSAEKVFANPESPVRHASEMNTLLLNVSPAAAVSFAASVGPSTKPEPPKRMPLSGS